MAMIDASKVKSTVSGGTDSRPSAFASTAEELPPKFVLPKRYDLCFNQSMLIFTADVSEFTALSNKSTK
jgi:hypothetical protein